MQTMKKIFFLAISFGLFSAMSFAQTEQGKVVLSGSTDLNFSSVKSQMEYDGEDMGSKVSTSKFSFTPSVGYFIMDNLALSIGLEFESEKQGDMKSNSLMAGPGLTYYFGTSNIKPFLQGDLMFGSMKQDNGDDEATLGAFGYDLGAGIAVFLNQHIALDFGLGYVAATLTSDEDSKFKVKTGGVVFAAGVSVYL